MVQFSGESESSIPPCMCSALLKLARASRIRSSLPAPQVHCRHEACSGSSLHALHPPPHCVVQELACVKAQPSYVTATDDCKDFLLQDKWLLVNSTLAGTLVFTLQVKPKIPKKLSHAKYCGNMVAANCNRPPSLTCNFIIIEIRYIPKCCYF